MLKRQASYLNVVPQSVAEECEYATVDMLPELFVSPW